MSTALAAWRRHRVDYRWPAFLAFVLAGLILALVPRAWRFLEPRPVSAPALQKSLAPFFAEDEGLQLIDVRLLHSSPGQRATESAPTVVRTESPRKSSENESPESGTGENDYAFDPTSAYRIGSELVRPDSTTGLGAQRSIDLSFGSIVASRKDLALAPRDTQAVRAELNFAKLQREIFLKNAPRWATEKATQRARELYLKYLMSNPLRGPQ